MSRTDDVSPAGLRAEVSPVSERFVSTSLGDAVVVFDRADTDRWICSDAARELAEMR